MILRPSRFAALVVCTCALFVLAGGQAVAQTESGGEETFTAPPLRRSTSATLDARLAKVVERYRLTGVAGAIQTARAAKVEVTGQQVEVVVRGKAGSDSAVQSALAAANAVVERRYEDLTKASVPVSELAALSTARGVRTVHAPHGLKLAALSGEGVAASNAAIAQAAGDKGAGVKIAIVDGGFAGLATRQGEGELPPTGAQLSVHPFCGDVNASNHGTAVAEIVHEVAPDAQLYLICIEDEVDLGAAKDFAIANGVQILNLSGGFYNTSRGDGSGGANTPEGIIAAARSAGILPIVAAGNEARSHWSGTFTSADGDVWHDFAAGDEGISFTGPACVFLKWDAWPTTTTQDFDFLVFSADTGQEVARSDRDQISFGLDPTEAACVPASRPQDEVFVVAIARFAGTAPRMDLFVDRGAFHDYAVASSSLLEPASSPAALAAGALCWKDGSLASYSSRGPTIDGRVKPDIAGFDSTTSATYGPFNIGHPCGVTGFAGTSAAAPHAAGVAAIVKQRNPAWTATQVQAHLEATAQDLGAAGKDSEYGAGRLRLDVPPTGVTLPVDFVGPRMAVFAGIYNPNRWPGFYHWDYSTDFAFGTYESTPSVAFAAGDAVRNVSTVVEGLDRETVYFARFVVENTHGASTGIGTPLTTNTGQVPFIVLGAPTGLTTSSVTLGGSVNPNGLETSYRIRWGLTFPPFVVAAEGTIPAGAASVPVSATVAGLQPGTFYRYRIEATNTLGMRYWDGEFVTAAAPPPPPPPPPTGGGSGGGGGGGAGPDVEVSLSASNATPAPNEVIEVRATVLNKSLTAAGRGLRAEIVLPVGVTLLGPAAVDTGPGCTGAATLDCNLDYLSPNSPTRVRFAVNVGPAGTKAITMRATMSVTDPNLANNTGSLSLDVRAAAPAPQAPRPTAPAAGKTLKGTAKANVLRGTPRADTLRGLGGSDRLYGGSGNDRLFGGLGNDRLEGGLGRDLLDAGSGNDLVLVRDKAVDTIRCGTGRDVVVADRTDKVAKDCETVRRK